MSLQVFDDAQLAENLREAFVRYDTCGTGYITPPELNLVLSSVGLPVSYASKIMDHIDMNHDGKISFEEMSSFVEGRVQRLRADFNLIDGM